MFLSIMSILGAALSAYLGFLLIRYPHLRRMAWRNLLNQRQSSLFTVLGLAISTALIAMVLYTNVSLSRAVDMNVAKHFGPIAYDIPTRNQPALHSPLFDSQSIRNIREGVQGEVLPIAAIPATFMTRSAQGEIERMSPYIHTFGVNWPEAIRFDASIGELYSSGPKPDEAYLSSSAAAKLKVKPGDVVYVVDASNQERRLQVSQVIPERGLTGYLGIYQANATAIVSLETARVLAGIQNPEFTNVLLDRQPSSEWKGEPVRERYANEHREAITFLTFVIGTVSVNAVIIGIVLITNIFRLIAEERRREMGILRAIGLSKSNLRRLLTIEGLLYGLFSGIIGVCLGWLLAYLLIWQITSATDFIPIISGMAQLTIDPVVILSGISFGLLIVFICVTSIAGKAIQTSIIDAIHSVHPYQQTDKNYSLKRSWIFILACLVILTFAAMLFVPDFRREWVRGDRITLIAVIFLSIPGQILLLVQCLPAIGKVVSYLFRKTAAPSLVLRLAFRNLNMNPFRTGLNMFMFTAISCFICFSIVYSSAMNQIMHTGDPKEQTGGHDLAARDWRPLDTQSIVRHMQATGDDDISSSLQVAAVQQLDWKKETGPWGLFEFKINGIDNGFAESNEIPLLTRDDRYKSDREAWRELVDNDGVVIIAADVLDYTDGHAYRIGDLFPVRVGDKTVFQTIIAIARGSGYYPESYGIWTNQNVLAKLAKNKIELHSTVFIKLGADNAKAEKMKNLLAQQNIYPITNIAESEKSYYTTMIFILRLLRNFNMAALVIGMIGLIVVMYRLIRQRSHQIGVLRAIGAGPRIVLLSVLLEGFLIGSFGITLGFTAGTSTSYLVFHTLYEQLITSTTVSLSLPALELIGCYSAALALSFFLACFPARKALHVSPTEAVRITS